MEALMFGTTHVAIGFVDLGGLAASSQLLEVAANSPAGSSRTRKQLRWVGYEMSAVCVAKTLVLLEMMQGTASNVDQVLQVGLP
jgi:hypothetical protein